MVVPTAIGLLLLEFGLKDFNAAMMFVIVFGSFVGLSIACFRPLTEGIAHHRWFRFLDLEYARWEGDDLDPSAREPEAVETAETAVKLFALIDIREKTA